MVKVTIYASLKKIHFPKISEQAPLIIKVMEMIFKTFSIALLIIISIITQNDYQTVTDEILKWKSLPLTVTFFGQDTGSGVYGVPGKDVLQKSI